MTDIRKCAQAVIDAFARREADDDGREVIPIHAIFANIESLRQALAEPVEPVGKKLTREELSHTDGRIEFVWWKDIPHGAFIYTTPPSVDALIAEAVAKEREACAIACEAVGKCTEVEAISNAFASHIRARGQK